MALTSQQAIGSTNILIVDSSICHAGEGDTIAPAATRPAIGRHSENLLSRWVHSDREAGDRLSARISLDWASSSVQNVISRALSMASVGAVTMMGMSDDGGRGVL